jgi:hypothetical protein
MKIDLSGKIEHSGKGQKREREREKRVIPTSSKYRLHISLLIFWGFIPVRVRWQT